MANLFAPPSREELEAVAKIQPNKREPRLFDPPNEDELAATQIKMQAEDKKSAGLLKNLEAGIESFGKEASFGYLPELQAAAEPYMFKALSAITGKDVESEGELEDRKRSYVQRSQKLREDAPIASAVGMLGGALSTPIPGVGAAGGLGKAVTRGALSGAISAGAYNPYADSEEIGFGGEQRLKNAKTGGLLGGGLSALAPSVSKLGKMTKEAGDALSVRALGPFKKQMKNLLNQNKYDDVAEFTRKNFSLVGSDAEDILTQSNKMTDDLGKQIGEVYKKAKEKLARPEIVKNLSPENLRKISKTGRGIAAGAMEELSEKYGKKTGGKQAINFLEKQVLEPLSSYGDDIESLMKFRSQELDPMIKWAKVNEIPASQEALRDVRKIIQNTIDDKIGALDDVLGSNELKRLKKLNKDFSLAATVKEISMERTLADKANNLLGLPEWLWIAGAGAGGTGGDFTPEGIAKGLLSAGALKVGRKYGPGIGARAFSPGGGLLQSAGDLGQRLSPEIIGRIVGPRREQENDR